MIAFTPHATNGANGVNPNVDGIGAKPLRTSPGADLLAGTIIQGTPYVAVYNNSDGVFYLQGDFGNPYIIPLGAGMDYWLPTAPNSTFVFPIGQAISRTTYATLFAGMGTTYGVGDGSTTFNLPDKTGRVSAMLEPAQSRLTPAFFGGNLTNLGATGGSESRRLTAGELPTVTSSTTQTITVTAGGNNIPTTAGTISNDSQLGTGSKGNYGQANAGWGNATNFSGTNTISVSSNNIGNNAHVTVPPTIICNYIMRVV